MAKGKYNRGARWRKDAPGVVRARKWQLGVRQWKPDITAAKCQYRQPVVAFDIKTGGMQRFASMDAAGRFCVERGLSTSVSAARLAVAFVCGGLRKGAFGFVWRLDIQALDADGNGNITRVGKWEKGLRNLDDLKRKYALLVKRPVIGFEIDGERIVRFPSGKAAAVFCVAEGLASSVGSSAAMISEAVRGRRRSACGFEWGCDWSAVEERVDRLQPVIARIVGGKGERRYASESAAARDMVRLGLAKTVETAKCTICRACSGVLLTVYGRTWRIAPRLG